MINAAVERVHWESGNMSYRVTAKGHAGAGAYGQDIVCAAVSCLMQTLAAKVDEAGESRMLNSGSVKYTEGGMEVEACPKKVMEETVAAWYSFVQEGLDALAMSYPDHVELAVSFVSVDKDRTPQQEQEDQGKTAMNLQLFAEGGAEGAAAGEGAAAADQAPAVEMPALRPAQERLARRSGAMKGKAQDQAPAQAPETDPAEEPEKQPEEKPEQKPQEEKTREQRRREFGELMQGEYSDFFGEMMQQAVERATQNIQQNPQVQRLTTALSNAYGVDVEDLEGLIQAVEGGKIKDDAYYEELAVERGVSVKTARELDKMESDLARANSQNQKLQALKAAAERQQRQAQIQAQWEAQAAQLAAQYPDFDLGEVLENPQVGELMRRGVSLPDAYRAAYFDHIMEQATGRTAKQVEQGVAARIQQRASRPAENGTRPGGAVTTRVDVASMSRKQLEDLERRARRGEKITL